MAHMACVDHGRRVVFTTKSIIHRNGDGSPCDSKLFKIGPRVDSREETFAFARGQWFRVGFMRPEGVSLAHERYESAVFGV